MPAAPPGVDLSFLGDLDAGVKELREARRILSGHITWCLVADVVVQRMTAVGQPGAAVATGSGTDQRAG
jgi:hypothetical protein